MRKNLETRTGKIVTDDQWDQIIKKVETPIRNDLKEALPQAFWFPLYEMAEKGDLIVNIDGKDIGKEIRQMRGLINWLNQKKKYYGW